MQHRYDIDGLRALAVMPVVLFHAGVPGLGGGFVGVDVFFVISGFLITGILARELDAGRFSIVGFYERRVRRIFPALFVMLGVTAGVGACILLPHELETLGRSTVAAALFVSNILFWRQSGYFDAEAHQNPLLHTWSLAVEEQYYILFPIALWLIWRSARTWRIPILMLAAAGSFALSLWGVQHQPTGTFYLLPTRAWELLAGALLALQPVRFGRRAEAAAALGVLLIVGSVLLLKETLPFPGLAALPPVLGATLVLAAAPGTRIGRLLSAPPLTGIGLISYSLYLWHWPVLVFLGLVVSEPDAVQRALAVGLAGGLAWASWRFVEAPFRTRRFGRRSILLGGTVCLVLAAVGGGALAATHGLPWRLSPNARAVSDEARFDLAALEAGYDCATPFDGQARFGRCPLGPSRPGRPDVVVIGDSHAMAVKPLLETAFLAAGRSGWLASSPGCPPLLDLERVGYGRDCVADMRQAFDAAMEDRPETIVLIGSWTGALTEKETVFDGRTSHDPSTRARNISDALSRTVAVLHARDIEVVFAYPAPGGPEDTPTRLARGGHPRLFTSAEIQRRFAPLRAAVTRAGVDRTIDFTARFCGPDRCAVTEDGAPLYMDQSHINARGRARIEPALIEVFVAP